MQTPLVTTLYRHPVKGFTPESCEELHVSPPGYIRGDRVLGILLGDAGEAHRESNGGDWWPKPSFVTLMTTPGLARLTLHYDETERRVRIEHGGELLVDATLDGAGREAIAAAVEAYVRTLDEAPDLDRPGRTPLRVVGDGVTPRYQDSGAGRVTLHSRASLEALGGLLDDPTLDERRFRSNIVIDGIGGWEELGWGGRTLRVGELAFTVVKPVVRCMATHANPAEGVRDRDMLKTLPTVNGLEDPSFAMALTPLGEGVIRTGDLVAIE
jgi:uncharacterized protein